MQNSKILLGNIDVFADKEMSAVEIEGIRYLIIQRDGEFHVLENACGHFGVSLDDGTLENEVILCRVHGISFSIKTGEIVNRPFENADPVRVFRHQTIDGKLYVLD